MAAVVLALAACSDSQVNTEPEGSPSSSGSTVGTPTPKSTIPVQARPADEAYEAFNAAAYEAQRHPFGLNEKIPAGADFTKHSFDPFRGEYQAFILGLANQGGEYRGTPPQLNVTVEKIELKATPWPKVTLSDCQTGDSDWRLYNAKTGAVQSTVTQKVSPPYRSTVTMILFDNHWGIQKLTLDSSRTCAP